MDKPLRVSSIDAGLVAPPSPTPFPPGEGEPGTALEWVTILRREIKADPRKKAGVAERMGVKRAYVSRAIATVEGRSSGFPAGVPKSFIARVLDMESDVDCPATGGRIARAECRKALQPAPTHNPLAMRIWRECQTCAIKPHQETKS